MPGRKAAQSPSCTSSSPLILILRWEIELPSLIPPHQPKRLAYHHMSSAQKTHQGAKNDNTFFSLVALVVVDARWTKQCLCTKHMCCHKTFQICSCYPLILNWRRWCLVWVTLWCFSVTCCDGRLTRSYLVIYMYPFERSTSLNSSSLCLWLLISSSEESDRLYY